MKGQRWLAVAVVSLTLFECLMTAVAPRAAAQGQSLQVVSTTYYIVQGESDLFPGEETASEFSCLRIMTFDLPYDVTRVYASVPDNARNLTTWVASHGLINTSFGRETTGTMSGSLYIDVPSWFDRTSSTTNSTNTSQSISSAGSSSTNLTYDAGALHLVGGSTEGYYLSAQIPVPEAVSIVSGNLTIFGTGLQNVTSEISNDHGSTWTVASPGEDTLLPTSGTAFHVRLNFRGNESTPLVTGFEVSIRYAPPSTSFTVHVSYVLEGTFQDGKLKIDLTEPVPYIDSGSSFVWLYLNRGYSAKSAGFRLNLDENGDASQPEKTVFVNMTLSLSGVTSRSITVYEPRTNWLGVAVAAATALVVAVGVYVVWRRRGGSTMVLEDQVAAEPKPAERPFDDPAKRKSELLARKKEIAVRLEELSRGTGASATAVGGADEASSLRAEYRAVRNELNRISRKKDSGNRAATSGEHDDSYDLLLASIAKLDDDFDSGRLPQKSYDTLRKEYTSKAATMLAERDAVAGGIDPLEAEKTKLMEAIVALEDERMQGKLDSRVYEELRASYRKELASIMRKMDESRET